MTQMTFDPQKPASLTERELNLLRTLRTHLKLNQKDTFIVDTLRMLGFDRFMPKDTLGRINYGTFFLKAHHWGKLNQLVATCQVN